jgi:hypothetical protein
MRLDTKMVKEMYPEVAAACTKQGEPSRVFLVK